MKITRLSQKRQNYPPKPLQEFIEAIVSIPKYDLSSLLSPFTSWPFPRANLVQWIPALNRFDQILIEIVEKYNLQDVQLQEFSSDDKPLVLEILRFSTFLLVHCVNRTIYNSAESLSALLNTIDLDVLYSTLKLLNRLAALGKIQRDHKISNFPINSERLFCLARHLPSEPMEKGFSKNYETLLIDQSFIPDDWKVVKLNYYIANENKFNELVTPRKSGSFAGLHTPKPKNRAIKGSPVVTSNQKIIKTNDVLKELVISRSDIDSKSFTQILDDHASDLKNMSPKLKQAFIADLMNVKCLDLTENRRKIIACGILAIATVSYITTDSIIRNRLLSIDYEFANHMADLIAPDSHLSSLQPLYLRVSAITALEGLTRMACMISPIATALNASVNHGIAISLLNEIIEGSDRIEGPDSVDYKIAYFALLHEIISTTTGSSMLSAAGLVGALVDTITKMEAFNDLRTCFRAISILYQACDNHQQAYTDFLALNGLEIVVKRIEVEVQIDISNFDHFRDSVVRHRTMDYSMPYKRASILKILLRFILHLMRTSGTSGELRNLINSSLLVSLCHIFENSEDFGSAIFCIASEIMNTFIHHEPTSYSVIHEAGLSQAFLNTVKRYVHPTMESIGVVLQSFYAICLNNQGKTLFQQCNPLKSFFDLFLSPEHVRVVSESDVVNMLGTFAEEFLRYHPWVNDQFCEQYKRIFSELLILGPTMKGESESIILPLLNTSKDSSDLMFNMKDSSETSMEKSYDNECFGNYVVVLASYFEGLMNKNQVKAFLDADGLENFLRLLSLDTIPIDLTIYESQSGKDSFLISVFGPMIETSADLIFSTIVQYIRSAFASSCIQGFLYDSRETSIFTKSVKNDKIGVSCDVEITNQILAKLNSIYHMINLMAELTNPVSLGRLSQCHINHLLPTLEYESILHVIGQLQRICIYEELLFSKDFPKDWVKAVPPFNQRKENEKLVQLSPDITNSLAFQNFRKVKIILSRFHKQITGFLCSTVKFVSTKRSSDVGQRQKRFVISRTIAIILKTHLLWQRELLEKAYYDINIYPEYVLTCLLICKACLIDPYSLSHPIQAALIVPFSECNGFELLFELAKPILHQLSKNAIINRNKRIFVSLLTVIYTLLTSLSHYDKFLESPQTTALSLREKTDNSVKFQFNVDKFHFSLVKKIVSHLFFVAETYTFVSLDLNLVPYLMDLSVTCLNNEYESINSSLNEDENFESLSITEVFLLLKAKSTHDDPSLTMAELGYPRNAIAIALDASNNIGAVANQILFQNHRLLTHFPGSTKLDTQVSLNTISVDKCNDNNVPSSNDIIQDFRNFAKQNFEKLYVYCLQDKSIQRALFDYFVAICAVKQSVDEDILRATFDSALHKTIADTEASNPAKPFQLIALLCSYDLFETQISRYTIEALPKLLEFCTQSTSPDCKTPIFLVFDHLLQLLDSGQLIDDTTMDLRKTILYSLINQLGSRPINDDLMLVVLKSLARLTLRRQLASLILKENHLITILHLYKDSTLSKRRPTLKKIIFLIYRHMLEIQPIVSKVIENSIMSYFQKQDKTSNGYIPTYYVTENTGAIMRDSSCFLNISQNLLKSLQVTADERYIDFKDYEKLRTFSIMSEPINSEMSCEKLHEASSCVHLVINEILCSKENYVLTEVSSDTPIDIKTMKQSFFYRSFLVECLLDSIANFHFAKSEVVNFSKKYPSKSLDINAITENSDITCTLPKLRYTVINLMLHDLVNSDSFNANTDPVFKLKEYMSFNALKFFQYILYPICDYAEKTDDIQMIRKFVIEAIAKSIRDCIACADISEAKCKKLAIYCDLCYHLLNPENLPKGLTSKFVAREQDKITGIFLEKNFTSLIASCVSEVDANFASSRKILKLMLRPLKVLTNEVPRFSKQLEEFRQTSIQSEPFEITSSSSSSENSLSEDFQDDDDPDLYRNSALGMLHGELASEELTHSSAFDEIDDYGDIDDTNSNSEMDSDISEENMSSSHEMDIEVVLDENDAFSDDYDESITDGTDSEFTENEDLQPASIDFDLVDEENIEDDDLISHSVGALTDLDDEDDTVENDDELDEIDEDDNNTEIDEDDITNGSFSRNSRSIIRRGTRSSRLILNNITLLENELPNVDELRVANTHRNRDLSSNNFWVETIRNSMRLISATRPEIVSELTSRHGQIQILGRSSRYPLFSRRSILVDDSRSEALDDDMFDFSSHPLLDPNFYQDNTSNSNSTQIETDEIAYHWYILFNDLVSREDIRLLYDKNDLTPTNQDISEPSENDENRLETMPSPKDISEWVKQAFFDVISSTQNWMFEARVFHGPKWWKRAEKFQEELLNNLVKEEVGTMPLDEKQNEEALSNGGAEEMEQDGEVASGIVDIDPSRTAHDSPNRTSQNTEPHSSLPSERQLVNIRGHNIDITDLGIDPEFLEAMPDDLVEDVVAQYVSADSELSHEFLNALPPDIRVELLEQEAHERLNRERSSVERYSSHEDMESRSLSDEAITRRPRSQNFSSEDRSLAVSSDAVNVLDFQGIIGLVLTLFLPRPASGRKLLSEILLSLCANRESRCHVLYVLIAVVNELSNETMSIDKIHTILHQRLRHNLEKSPTNQRHKEAASFKNIPPIQSDCSRPLLLWHFIDVLHYLLSNDSRVPGYFLTEHHPKKYMNKVDIGLNFSWNIYPINVILLALGSPSIRRNMTIVELLTSILSSITKTLIYKVKKQEKKSNSEDNDESARMKKRVMIFIPGENLKCLIDVIIAPDCTSRAFQSTIANILRLCVLPGHRKIFKHYLIDAAKEYSELVAIDLKDLQQSLTCSKFSKDGNIADQILTNLARQNSKQTQLLRVLKALDYLFGKKLDFGPNDDTFNGLDDLYKSLNLSDLWQLLSTCLEASSKEAHLYHVASVLLPLIESLMVVCEASNRKSQDISGHENNIVLSNSNNDNDQSSTTVLMQFIEKHRKMLNQMVRINPSLMSGSFSLLVQSPKALDFDNKRKYFSKKLHDKKPGEYYVPINVNVRRNQVFLDSFRSLYYKKAVEFKYSRLNIRFQGEEGIDAGGVAREWYSVLARQMFNADYALFLPVASDRTTFHPNKMSAVNPDHLSYFTFVGRIIAKAIFDGRLLDSHFSRPIYKLILGKQVNLKDMESIDPEYYNSLLWMLENNIEDLLSETFSVEDEYFGEKVIVELVPDGKNITVTDDNKQDYIRLMVEYRLYTSVQKQLDSFIKGFREIIPLELIGIFNEQELELIISGLPEIDIDDWKNNTTYVNYTPSSPQIIWFWRAVRSFDKEEKAKLLQFATGTSKVPLGGFAELEGLSGIQKFSLHRDFTSSSRLPQSHTCFNQIDLPEYETYEQLRLSLFTAINEGSEGFGFA